MNEEENQAINYLKEFRDNVYAGVGTGSVMAKNIGIIFDIIDKQQRVIDEMAKELANLPIPISQEENILFFNSLAVKDFFIKKDKIKAKIEELASNEHIRWANWQKYVHSLCIKNEDGSLTIPKEYVEHWEYEINTEYKDLPEKIKESDRKEVRQILEVLGE